MQKQSVTHIDSARVDTKRNKKIHRDKKGRDFIKETYFVGGKMKFRRIYVIDGIPADEFYQKNATDMDFFVNEDFELINCKEQNKQEPDLPDNIEDLPF